MVWREKYVNVVYLHATAIMKNHKKFIGMKYGIRMILIFPFVRLSF